jgi:hypothetical protein
MRHVRVIPAIFIIAILAISIAESAPTLSKDQSSHQFNSGVAGLSQTQSLKTSIKVGEIDYGSAAPGNSEPVTLTIQVVNPLYPTGICHLNESNFKIEVPTHGFSYTAIAIKNVKAEWFPRFCDCKVQIAPWIFQGKQYKWANSPGAFNLYYFKGENQLAVTTFNLKMFADYP